MAVSPEQIFFVLYSCLPIGMDLPHGIDLASGRKLTDIARKLVGMTGLPTRIITTAVRLLEHRKLGEIDYQIMTEPPMNGYLKTLQN